MSGAPSPAPGRGRRNGPPANPMRAHGSRARSNGPNHQGAHFNWKGEPDVLLRALTAEGRTDASIAAELNKRFSASLSRSAVQCRRSHLGLRNRNGAVAAAIVRWTGEPDDLLQALAKQGWTDVAIARELNRRFDLNVSRSAVQGRRSHHGIHSPRSRSTGLTGKAGLTAPPSPGTAATGSALPFKGYVPVIHAIPPPPEPQPPVGPSKTCLWMEGGYAEGKAPLFCGAPSVAGVSYCQEHRARVYSWWPACGHEPPVPKIRL